MEYLMHEPAIGSEVRRMIPHKLDRPNCSPCFLKITDAPLDFGDTFGN